MEESGKKKNRISLRNKRIIIITIFVLLISLCAYTVFALPESHSFCVFRNKLGVLCSACGGMHCAQHLMRFQFIEAFNENQFLVFALPVFGYLIVGAMINGFFNRKIFPVIKNKYFYISFFVLFLAFGVARNYF